MSRNDLPPEGGYFIFPRYISLAVIIAFLGQMGGFIWYAAKLDSRISYLEARDAENKSKIVELFKERDRVIRLEEQMKTALELLARIDRRLEPAPR